MTGMLVGNRCQRIGFLQRSDPMTAEPALLFPDPADADLAARARAAIDRDDGAVVPLLVRLADRLSAQGRGLEAIALRERALVLRRSFDGAASALFAADAEALVLLCNTVAMQQLGAREYAVAAAGLGVAAQVTRPPPPRLRAASGAFDVALRLLRKAEALSDPRGVLGDHARRPALRAATLNNLGCYYKEQGQLHTALRNLEQALAIESTCASPSPRACARRAPARDAAARRSRVAGQRGQHAPEHVRHPVADAAVRAARWRGSRGPV